MSCISAEPKLKHDLDVRYTIFSVASVEWHGKDGTLVFGFTNQFVSAFTTALRARNHGSQGPTPEDLIGEILNMAFSRANTKISRGQLPGNRRKISVCRGEDISVTHIAAARVIILQQKVLMPGVSECFYVEIAL